MDYDKEQLRLYHLAFEKIESHLKRGLNDRDHKGAVQKSLVVTLELKTARRALKEHYLSSRAIEKKMDDGLEDRLNELLGLDNEDNPEGAQ
jgi:hypothetical protein